jgi:hypothetical protein
MKEKNNNLEEYLSIDCKGLLDLRFPLLSCNKKHSLIRERKEEGIDSDLMQKSHLLPPLFLKSAKGSSCVETLS